MSDNGKHPKRAQWVRVLFLSIIVTAPLLATVVIVREMRHMNQYGPLTGINQIRDDGAWSFPRYTASLPSFQVGQGVPYSSTVRGLPRAVMTFSLKVRNGDPSRLRRIRSTGIEPTLTARFLTDAGHEIFGVTAPLSDWKMAESANDARLWHVSLRDIPFEAGRQYTLEVTFTGLSEGDTGLTLAPQLTWGGNELP